MAASCYSGTPPYDHPVIITNDHLLESTVVIFVIKLPPYSATGTEIRDYVTYGYVSFTLIFTRSPKLF